MLKSRYKIMLIIGIVALVPAIVIFGPVALMITSNMYSGFVISTTPNHVFEEDFAKIPEVMLFIEKYPNYKITHHSDFLGWKIINYHANAGEKALHLSVKKSVLHHGVRISAGCSVDESYSYSLNITEEQVMDYIKNDKCLNNE